MTVPLTSCLTGLESGVWHLTIFVFICKTDISKPVKQEVNSTVILPPIAFPGFTLLFRLKKKSAQARRRKGLSLFYSHFQNKISKIYSSSE
jgi:hypothetical protein